MTGKRTRRQIVPSGAAAVALTVIGAACAPFGGAGSTGTSETAAKTKAPVKLRFSSWGTRDWGHEGIIERFKQKNPHVVEVQIEDGGPFVDYRVKLLNQIATDDVADVPTVGGQWYLEMVGTGAMIKLDSYVQQEQKRRPDFYLPKVPAEIMDKGKVQGALYGLPYLADTGLLFVNERLFRDRGQALPPTDWNDARWTWETALERARAVTNPGASGGGTFGFFLNDTLLCDWASTVYQRGGDVLSPDRKGFALDKPEAYEPIQWRADLRLRHQVAATADEVRNGATFESGRIGMHIAWASLGARYQGQNLPFDWNVYPLPRWRKQTAYFHNAWTPVAKRSQAPDAAWDLAAYFSGPEGQGVLNPLVPTGERPKNAAGANNALKFIQPGASLYVPRWPEVQATINRGINEVMGGQRTAKDAFSTLKQQVEILL